MNSDVYTAYIHYLGGPVYAIVGDCSRFTIWVIYKLTNPEKGAMGINIITHFSIPSPSCHITRTRAGMKSRWRLGWCSPNVCPTSSWLASPSVAPLSSLMSSGYIHRLLLLTQRRYFGLLSNIEIVSWKDNIKWLKHLCTLFVLPCVELEQLGPYK